MSALAACLLAVLAACGSVKRPFKDDAPPTPSHEVVGGAARLSSTTFTFDVQLGHPISQQPVTSATFRAEGNAAIKP